MFRTIRKKIFRLAFVSGVGAAASYFFDKDKGEERRAQAKEKANGLMGKGSGGASWQPQAEHSANGFEPQVVGTTVPPVTATPVTSVTPPTVSDVVADPAPASADTTITTPRPVGS